MLQYEVIEFSDFILSKQYIFNDSYKSVLLILFFGIIGRVSLGP